jgi:hypothetical protein
VLKGLGFAGVLIALCLGQGVYPTSRGVLKSISRAQLSIQVDDEHEMKFWITRKTKIFAQSKEIKASSLQPGQAVAVEAQSAVDGSYEAVRVTVESTQK